MNIVIAGGSGFLGRSLAAALAGAGHHVTILSRSARPPAGASNAAHPIRTVAWSPDGSAGPWMAAIDGADAIVNLAGESIAARRWTAPQKRRILDSRVLATRSLVQAIRRSSAPPSVLVNGSAVGYYGPRGDEIVTEDTPAGTDFLADVCVRWEAEAMSAAGSRTRVAIVRTGLVLEREGGALPRMLPPFWIGVGGRLGSGRQHWPWIHRQDWIDLMRFVIETPVASGPFNATAPKPVPNAVFAKALGRAMHRPAFMLTPGFFLRLLLGEMADGLLLSGQRAIPANAERLGFVFSYPQIDQALADLFGR